MTHVNKMMIETWIKRLTILNKEYNQIYDELNNSIEETEDHSPYECGFGSFQEACALHNEVIDELKNLKTSD